METIDAKYISVLTPWNVDLLGKLRVIQLLKKPLIPFMEPSGTLPCSQKPLIEQDEKCIPLHTIFFKKLPQYYHTSASAFPMFQFFQKCVTCPTYLVLLDFCYFFLLRSKYFH